FYAVTPSETTFANLPDIPDYMEKVSPWMLLLTTLGLFLDRKNYAFNDSVTSVITGNLYLLFKFSGSILSITAYIAVYEKVHLFDLDIYNPWVWLLAFLAQDLIYYLGHRAMHEWGIFWAFHEMHHSSEYFNFSTAIRKPAFMEVGSTVFNLLQAFIIPPQLFVPHRHLNFVYQFWLHNEYVGSLGPLEYILCTPSNHRVHHGRNPYCIDRNYGGVLIIWDRMFGTFAEEREDEKIAYGLVHNVRSFNQIWLQWSTYDYFFRQKPFMKDANEKEYYPGLWNKFCSIFQPIGYFPGMKTRRFLWWRHLEDNTEGIPEVDHSVAKYNPDIAFEQKVYIFFQVFIIFVFSLEIDHKRLSLGWIDLWLQIALVVFSAQTFSYYLEKHHRARAIDVCRNSLIFAYLLRCFSLPLVLINLTSVPTLSYFAWRDDKQEKIRGKHLAGREKDG
ncbi:hypothetical protein PMAYCL1PPCAC_15862, partial [Pristionchus mayeri]